MRLKDGFILHKAGSDYVVVATGEASKTFNGLIRNNATAAFLFEKLQNDVTFDDLVKALLDKYDVTEEVARQDVKVFVDKLIKADILNE